MSAGPAREDLRAQAPERLQALLAELGERPFRARQLFRWLHRRGAASLEEMTDLPRELRRVLAERFHLTSLEPVEERRASDGTLKWTWRLHDGALVESVYMPHDGPEGEGDEAPRSRARRTLCLSTQVGCAVGCPFCLTGTMGLRRNLGAGEIVDQVHRANRRLVELGEGRAPRPLTNLVFMGMGEPLHNLEGLLPALEILLHPEGPDFSHRHVTVSTSGVVPAMARLGAESEVKLAVSLNATTDEQRDRLVPLNRRWPLADLLEACRRFPVRQGRRITFEYVLLGGVNDGDEDARRLSRLVAGIPAKVNLIPYNQNPGLGFEAPAPGRVEAFQGALLAAGLTAVVRRNRGRDIGAACGQLAVAGGQGRPRRAAPAR
jgi:23S rRNA (adenine2503-C2)-methyltransferase